MSNYELDFCSFSCVDVILIGHFVYCVAFYLTSYLGQKTVKGPFGLRVKVPPAAHLSTTQVIGFTLFLFNAERPGRKTANKNLV